MTDRQARALRLAERISDILRASEEDAKTIAAAADELARPYSENEAFQAGYAAARLEIESLKSQIANHADELTVAHLDGRMRAAQPAGAQQPDTAYAELPEHLTLAVDRWFAENTGLGGCSDKDVRELAALFYGVHHAGGRESVDDALAIVESFGPGIGGLNDTYARQILLAEEVKRLRASHGQAPAQAAPQQEAASVDLKTMELAESVGLIGPASRTNDLHAAIQRFHDLICANATIKAAQMAAEAISGASAHQRDTGYPPLPDFDTVEQHIYGACRRYITQDMLEPIHNLIRDAIDADRAARAPADSVTAPAACSGNLEQELAMLIRRIVSSARRNCEDGSNVLKLANEAWVYLVRKGLNGSPLRDAGIESDPTPAAQAADGVLEDAGGANWQDISTAPKDGTRFVAVGNNYGLYSEMQHTCIAQWFRGCWIEASDWNETSELKYLTHWMPLLPLPGSAARKQGANHD